MRTATAARESAEAHYRCASRGAAVRVRARSPASLPDASQGNPGGSRRIALCVGIDAYADNPLAGCRNDARAWGAALERLGFSVDYLFDQQATRLVRDDPWG
ncbi:MAG TPA: caspase family protein [Thermoanaerobaculia bacterium]|nr:caspase family protein [Thermoanaerobaculia bacterium]